MLSLFTLTSPSNLPFFLLIPDAVAWTHQLLLWLLFSLSVMSNSLWPHGLHTPGLPVSHHLLEFTQVHVRRIGDAIPPSYPLLPSSLPSIFPSIRVFFNATSNGTVPYYPAYSFIHLLPILKILSPRDFCCGSVVGTSHSHCWGPSFYPWSGN